MATETLAFTAAFEAGFVLRHQLQTMIQVSMPMLVLILSKNFLN